MAGKDLQVMGISRGVLHQASWIKGQLLKFALILPDHVIRLIGGYPPSTGAKWLQKGNGSMLTKARVIEILKEQYPYLAREYGIVRIGIFGSFASGTPKDTSDVDLVAEFNRPIGLRFVELTDYLEQKFGRKADVLTLAGLDSVRNPRIADEIQESIEYVRP